MEIPENYLLWLIFKNHLNCGKQIISKIKLGLNNILKNIYENKKKRKLVFQVLLCSYAILQIAREFDVSPAE